MLRCRQGRSTRTIGDGDTGLTYTSQYNLVLDAEDIDPKVAKEVGTRNAMKELLWKLPNV